MSDQRAWDEANAAGVWGVGWQQEDKPAPKRRRLKWTNTVTKQEGYGAEMTQEEFDEFVSTLTTSRHDATRDSVKKGIVRYELVEVGDGEPSDHVHR